VTLILATQRPSGVVSDQMKANMKFRICLRMETPEDSKELLNKPDAARLPQIAGRGYLQAGTEVLTEVQVAWSGSPYTDDRADAQYPTEAVLEALGTSEKPRSTLMWLVGALGAEAKRLTSQAAQALAGSAAGDVAAEPAGGRQLPAGRRRRPNGAFPGDRRLDRGRPQEAGAGGLAVEAFDWKTPLPLKAAIASMDDPYHSIQRLLAVDVAADPIAVVGASGRGNRPSSSRWCWLWRHSIARVTCTLLRAGLRPGRTAVAAQSAALRAIIDTVTPDRIEALFRMIRGMLNERQEKLANYPSRDGLQRPEARQP